MSSTSPSNNISLIVAFALLFGIFAIFGFLPPSDPSPLPTSSDNPSIIPLGTGNLQNPSDIQSGINTTGQSYSPQQAATLNMSEFRASGLNQ